MESIDSYTTSDLSRALDELGIEGRSRLVRKEDKYEALRSADWNGTIAGRKPEPPRRRSSPARRSPARKSPVRNSPGRRSSPVRNSAPTRKETESNTANLLGQQGSTLVRQKLFGVPESNKKSTLEQLLKSSTDTEDTSDDNRTKELAVAARLKALLESKMVDTLSGKKKTQVREFIKNSLDVLSSGSEYPAFTKSMLEKIFVDDQQMKTKGFSSKASEQLNNKAIDVIKNFLSDLSKHIPDSGSSSSIPSAVDLFTRVEKPLFSDEALLEMLDERVEQLKQKAREVPLFSEDESKVIIAEEFKRRNFFSGIGGAEIVPGNNYPLTVDDLLNSSYNFDRNKGFLLNLSSFISEEPKSSLSSALGYDGVDGLDLSQYSTTDVLKVRGAEYQRLLERKNSELSGEVSANIRFLLGKIRKEYDEQDLDIFRNSVDTIEKLYTLIVQKRIEEVIKDQGKKLKKKMFSQQGLNYASQILLPVYLEIQILDTIEKKTTYYGNYYKLGEDKVNEVVKFFEDRKKLNKKELFDKIIKMFIKTIRKGIDTFESDLQAKVASLNPSEKVKVKQINEVVINMILFQQSFNLKSRMLIYLSNERLFFDMKLLDLKTTSNEINVNTLVKLFDPEYSANYKTVTGKAYPGPLAAGGLLADAENNVDLTLRNKRADEINDLGQITHNRIIMNILLNVATCISKYYSKKIFGPDYAKIIKRYILLAKGEIAPIENELIKYNLLDKLNILFNLMYYDRPIPYAEILNKCFNRIDLNPSTSAGQLDEETEFTFMLNNVRNILISIPTNIVDYRTGIDTGAGPRPARSVPVKGDGTGVTSANLRTFTTSLLEKTKSNLITYVAVAAAGDVAAVVGAFTPAVTAAITGEVIRLFSAKQEIPLAISNYMNNATAAGNIGTLLDAIDASYGIFASSSIASGLYTFINTRGNVTAANTAADEVNTFFSANPTIDFLSLYVLGIATGNAISQGASNAAAVGAGENAATVSDALLTAAGPPTAAEARRRALIRAGYYAYNYDYLLKQFPGADAANLTSAAESASESLSNPPAGVSRSSLQYIAYAAAYVRYTRELAADANAHAEAQAAGVAATTEAVNPKSTSKTILAAAARAAEGASAGALTANSLVIPDFKPTRTDKLSSQDQRIIDYFNENLKYISLAFFDSISSLINCQKILKTIYNNVFDAKDDTTYFNLKVNFSNTYKLLIDAVYLVAVKVINYIASLAGDILPNQGDEGNVGIVVDPRIFTIIRSSADKKNIEALSTIFKNSGMLTQILRESEYYINNIIKSFKELVKDAKDEDNKKMKLEAKSVISNLQNSPGLDHMFVTDPDSVNSNVPENVDISIISLFLDSISTALSGVQDFKNLRSTISNLNTQIVNIAKTVSPNKTTFSGLGEPKELSGLDDDYKTLEEIYAALEDVKNKDNKSIYTYTISVFMFFISLLRAMHSLKKIIRKKSNKKKD